MALGDRLFHDPRLSYENAHSCNSCHDTSTNGATAPGSIPSGGALNVPTVFNAALNFRLNWEGDVRTLEDQTEQTLGKPQIMGSGSSVEEALRRLRADPDVARQFREAFGREPDDAGLVDAIAA
ncbi:MAG TPA: cytochrome-c peroxidase, partial [Roseiarcus sp.]